MTGTLTPSYLKIKRARQSAETISETLLILSAYTILPTCIDAARATRTEEIMSNLVVSSLIFTLTPLVAYGREAVASIETP